MKTKDTTSNLAAVGPTRLRERQTGVCLYITFDLVIKMDLMNLKVKSFSSKEKW